uniref:Uncharacterized protein n=1 Tax=Caenorhabditis japonica TaxID=281687 RepID=A0A8R1E678_CAEJA
MQRELPTFTHFVSRLSNSHVANSNFAIGLVLHGLGSDWGAAPKQNSPKENWYERKLRPKQNQPEREPPGAEMVQMRTGTTENYSKQNRPS